MTITLPVTLRSLDQGERGSGLGEREARMDVRRDPSAPAPIEQLDHVGAMPLGLARDESGPEHADDGAALEKDEIERKARDRSRGEAHHEISSVPSHGAQGRLGIVAADGIVEDIDPLVPVSALRLSFKSSTV